MNTSDEEVLRQQLQQALSAALRELRHRMPGKPSQEVVADRVGMERSYWGDLERGERALSIFSLWRMAQALGTSPSRLVLAIDRHYRRMHPQRAAAAPVKFAPQLKRLRTLMDQVPIMQWLGGGQGQNLYCNRPLLDYMGSTLEQVQGDGWREFVHPEDCEKHFAKNAKDYARRQPYSSRYRLRRADGEHPWVAEHAIPQFTSKGVFMGFLGTLIVIADPQGLEML